MSTPRRSNAEIQFSEDEDETESASVIRHVVSHDGHKEASELVNTVNFPAVAIEIQRDFLTSIHAEVTRRFPELSFVISRVSVDSNTEVAVLTISQRRLFVHPPYGMVSRIQGYVQYKTYCISRQQRVSVDSKTDKCHVQKSIESVFARANQSVINTLLCN